MSDNVTAKGSESKFKPHPEGQFVAQCVDVINLGEFVQKFPGTPDYLVQKCVLVFRTGERNEEIGEFIDLGQEFTVSMGDKANLRKFMEQWRGKPYETHQIEQGVSIDKMTSQHGLITVAQKTSGKGRKYANITACVGIPKQMAGAVTKYADYKRADYWSERAKAYAEDVKKYRAEHMASGPDEDFSDFPDDEGSEELPF